MRHLVAVSCFGLSAGHRQQGPHWEAASPEPLRWSFDMRYYNQILDHFNAFEQGTFSQRFLLNSSFWAGAAARAPLFFFTGAEGGAVTKWESEAGSYGHVLEMAERLGAMVVMMESRFYGESLPFGKTDSYLKDPQHVGLLTIEQVLLDFVHIIEAVRMEFCPARDCPVMTFGASLAGTQSAMMRMKYPNVVDLALASSSPLKGYAEPGVDQFAWRRRVTDTWIELASGQPIADLVRSGFSAIAVADAEAVQRTFNTCEAAYAGNNWDVRDVLWGILEGQAEFVYPRSLSLIPQRVQAAVAAAEGGSGLDVFAAIYNYDGRQPCMNLTANALGRQQPEAKSWDYIACTEIVHPIGSNNVTDFFPPGTWSVQDTGDYCSGKWGVRPLDNGLFIPDEFGFFDLEHFKRSSSRILFVYGGFDPWHEFQISSTNLSATLPVLHIPNGSHCSDMAGSRSYDTPDMVAARAQEERIIRSWIAEIQGELLVV